MTKKNQSQPCEVPCAGGNTCACNEDAAHPHTIHVCRKADCKCHDPAAYGVEMVTQPNGRELYIPTGARLVEAVKP
jgi:hypothetical protein